VLVFPPTLNFNCCSSNILCFRSSNFYTARRAEKLYHVRNELVCNYISFLAQSCNSTTGTQTIQALLISGQCYRFIYREQSGPLFQWHPPAGRCHTAHDGCLHCSPLWNTCQTFKGDVDAPPYINETNLNVSDIQYWFQSVRSANSVTVQLFDDVAIDAVDEEVFVGVLTGS
jgi:hypothetical protein